MTQGKSVDHGPLRDSIVRQLYRRSGARGQIQLPAAPGLVSDFRTTQLRGLFELATQCRTADGRLLFNAS